MAETYATDGLVHIIGTHYYYTMPYADRADVRAVCFFFLGTHLLGRRRLAANTDKLATCLRCLVLSKRGTDVY